MDDPKTDPADPEVKTDPATGEETPPVREEGTPDTPSINKAAQSVAEARAGVAAGGLGEAPEKEGDETPPPPEGETQADTPPSENPGQPS